MSFSQYPAYSESHTDWIDTIPQNWQLVSGKRTFENVRERAKPDADQLATTQAYGVIPQKVFMELQDQKVVLALSGTENFNDVRPDDFVISLRSFQGGIEHSAYSGCVSPAYTVLRIREKNRVDPKFFKYLLKERAYISALQSVTSGIREGRTITYDQFGSILLPVPSKDEQSQIARFLDYETTRIDALIEEQQRLIELLKEKRQAVISHAVTKGLDPNVPMKDSGVEWLGEVPAHWKVSKLGHYASLLTGFPFASSDFSSSESHVRLLRGANIGVGKLKWDDTVHWDLDTNGNFPDYQMEEGQLVLGMDRPWIGEGLRIAKVEKQDLPCLLLQRVAALTPASNLEADYLFMLLCSDAFRAYVEPDLTGVSVPHLSPEQILSYRVSLPEKNEQNAIVDMLQKQEAKFTKLLSEANKNIELLSERRAALISAAVTGKIDVRNWQSPAEKNNKTAQQEVAHG